MSLLDEVAEASANYRSGGRCSVGVARDGWTQAFRDQFDAALRSAHPSTAISDVLREKHGVEIAPQTLQRHRKNRCRCGSD
jgi:hypothetical protein